MKDFKPCGCLTDGRNWLQQCDAHVQLRRELAKAQQAQECWSHAVQQNMVRDGKDGVALIQDEVRSKISGTGRGS